MRRMQIQPPSLYATGEWDIVKNYFLLDKPLKDGKYYWVVINTETRALTCLLKVI